MPRVIAMHKNQVYTTRLSFFINNVNLSDRSAASGTSPA
ncbi:hypothetical protein P343_07460 [Sporolactobacillus laevolacticus DSM 442]|uniref:Uncharacterized protein n=1 Tax=Sporolactobacillus laevolacticus DSM 442 TaxID=1395513 RepID=V6IYE6_9BACL|nr:hypothetical protein P343_07460 [Sporolactobacillus laevolacticus DSM 442]